MGRQKTVIGNIFYHQSLPNLHIGEVGESAVAGIGQSLLEGLCPVCFHAGDADAGNVQFTGTTKCHIFQIRHIFNGSG